MVYCHYIAGTAAAAGAADTHRNSCNATKAERARPTAGAATTANRLR